MNRRNILVLLAAAPTKWATGHWSLPDDLREVEFVVKGMT